MRLTPICMPLRFCYVEYEGICLVIIGNPTLYQNHVVRSEDSNLKKAYNQLRAKGDRWSKGEDYCNVFPSERPLIKKKSQNIAGLQLVDLIASGQKLETIEKKGNGAPLPKAIDRFTKRVNDIVRPMVNPYGQYFLV